MVCVLMVILMQGLHAGQASRKHVASVSCRPKELTALTKSQVEESLTSFVSNIILCVSTVCLKAVYVSRSLSSSHWDFCLQFGQFQFCRMMFSFKAVSVKQFSVTVQTRRQR